MKTDKPEAPGTSLRELLGSDINLAAAGLMKVYQHQTDDEQAGHGTLYDNGMGFNGTDAPFLSAMAERIVDQAPLSDRMIEIILKCMPKYHGQLAGVFLRPLRIVRKSDLPPPPGPAPVRAPEPVEKAAELKTVPDGTLFIHITFPYDPKTVDQVKALSGRKWVKEDRCWTAPPFKATVDSLREWGFKIGPELNRWFNERFAPIEQREIREVPGLRGTPYPFQLEGISFIESHRGRALVGDEMGLGKTIQALGWLQLHPEARPAVVVCPASLKLNWERETERWTTGMSPVILNGRPQAGGHGLRMDPARSLIIINYDILKDWQTLLRDLRPKAVVLDECHYIKNRGAQRSKATQALCKGVPHVIALSGTPIVNRPVEMYEAIRLVSPDLFPSFWSYAQRYCGATYNGYGWDFSGASNEAELHKKLSDNIMIRRLKEHVLKDLPPKRRIVVPMEMENREEYTGAERDFIGWLKTRDPTKVASAQRAEVLTRIEALKGLCWKGKVREAVEWVRDFLDNGKKLVVFCTHTAPLEQIARTFGPAAVVVDGSVSQSARQEAVDRFQTDPKVRLFIGNIRAAGVGLTLTAASDTCFIELGWTPGEHDQAEDRVHRIGQTSDRVAAYYLIAERTIEDEIAALLDQKRTVLRAVLDGTAAQEESLLTALMARLSDRR